MMEIIRITEYDSLTIKEPEIMGVWIFLNSGYCLYRHNNVSKEEEEGQEQIITSLLSTIDSLFSEILDDRCNVVFGYKYAFYYNYLGLLNAKRDKSSLICVITTKNKKNFSISDLLSYQPLTIKTGQVLVSFFTRFMDEILKFNGNLDQFKTFDSECIDIINREVSLKT